MSVRLRIAIVVLGLWLNVGIHSAAAQEPDVPLQSTADTDENSPEAKNLLAAFADDPSASKANSNSAAGEKKPLGPPPEDNSELFLRTETVLLQPGQVEVDWGVEYVWQETKGLVLLPGDQLAIERVRLRQWFMPTALRFGLTDEVQPFVNLPWGLAEFERENPLASQADSDFGLGDLTAGFSYLMMKHQDYGVDVIAGFNFTAPTGSGAFTNFNTGNGTNATLGAGFWALSANLNFVKSIDPAVLFGGIGYTHEFERTENGFLITPGEILTYQFGMGFAINDNLTLSSMLQGQWQERVRVNGTPLFDSSVEPISLRMALTIVASQCRIIEPFIRFGLNNDAAAADFGVIITRRF